jgi:hypothetical protein
MMKLQDKKACTHPSVTLVQHEDEDEDLGTFWFAAYQCDVCGSLTRQEVTADDLEQATGAPWLDVDSYQSAAQERLEDESDWAALSFVQKAVSTLIRNGSGHK